MLREIFDYIMEIIAFIFVFAFVPIGILFITISLIDLIVTFLLESYEP